MIYLVTGTTGAKKTAYVVSILDKLEIDNKVNIAKNPTIYQKNLDILAKYDLLSELSYYIDEQGSGDTYRQEIVILDDDYYEMLGVDDYDLLRPDDYFKRSSRFNKMIGRIHDKHGDLGLSAILPVRTIYTNIEALKIDYVRSLTPDWRDCPDGSLIVIDEVQLVYPYSDIKDRSNPIITELSVHRHRGFDFYLITQSAGNLHVLIKDLVYTHYHVTIPFGFQTKIYQYGEFKANPNAKSVKLLAENSFSFTPSQHIFKLYKSTNINTAKSRLPIKRLVVLGSFVAFGLFLVFYALFGSKNPVSQDKFDEVQTDSQSADNVITQDTQPTTQGQGEPMPQPNLEHLTKDELIEYVKTREKHAKNELDKYKLQVEQERLAILMQYDNLQKQLLEHDKQIKDFYARLELYKNHLPKNYDIIKQDPNLQVRAVVKKGNKCNAYNTSGDLMTLSFDECNYYLEQAGRVHRTNGQTTNIKADPVPKIMNENPNFGQGEAPQAPPQTEMPSTDNS